MIRMCCVDDVEVWRVRSSYKNDLFLNETRNAVLNNNIRVDSLLSELFWILGLDNFRNLISQTFEEIVNCIQKYYIEL